MQIHMFFLLQNLQQLKCFDLIFVLYYAIVTLKKSSMSLFIIIKLSLYIYIYVPYCIQKQPYKEKHFFLNLFRYCEHHYSLVQNISFYIILTSWAQSRQKNHLQPGPLILMSITHT